MYYNGLPSFMKILHIVRHYENLKYIIYRLQIQSFDVEINTTFQNLINKSIHFFSLALEYSHM